MILKVFSLLIRLTHNMDSSSFFHENTQLVHNIDDSLQNVKLLQQFISPQTGMVFDPTRTGKKPCDALRGGQVLTVCLEL